MYGKGDYNLMTAVPPLLQKIQIAVDVACVLRRHLQCWDVWKGSIGETIAKGFFTDTTTVLGRESFDERDKTTAADKVSNEAVALKPAEQYTKSQTIICRDYCLQQK